MKKVLSLVLALIFVLTAFSAIAVSAADDKKEDGDVLASMDFSQLYTTLGGAVKDRFDIQLNAQTKSKISCHPIFYCFSSGTPGAGDNHYRLTSDGLSMGNVYRYYSGIVVETAPFEKEGAYCLSFTIDMNVDKYFYFGWQYGTAYEQAFDSSTTQKTSITANTTNDNGTKNTNIDISSGSLVPRGSWKVDPNGMGSASDMYAHISRTATGRGGTTTYTFEVKDGVCKKMIMSTPTNEVTLIHETGMKTTEGAFGFVFRNGSEKTKECGALIRDIKVTYGSYVSNVAFATREMPAEPQKAYTDSLDTNYVPGYVLHNMDFSKVTKFEDTKYFMTNNGTSVDANDAPVYNSETDTFASSMIENGVLKIKTKGAVNLLFTGNAIPKNIKNYSASITFRFVDATSKANYLAFIQSAVINETNGVVTSSKNTCLRFKATDDADAVSGIDSATATDDAAWAAVSEKIQAGEFVTLTYSAVERYCAVIKVTAGDKSAMLVKNANTEAKADSYMGLIFAPNSSFEIKSVQIVAADSMGEYENLTWPAEAGALVQNVAADAIDLNEVEDIVTVATTTEATTTEATTTEATTAAEKKGCGSSLALSGLVVAACGAVALTVAKKKED